MFYYRYSLQIPAVMSKNISITLVAQFHRGRNRLLVRFWYNVDILAYVRSIGGRYSNTYSCWYVNYSAENIKYLKEQLANYDVRLVKGNDNESTQNGRQKQSVAKGACDYIGQLTKMQEEEIKLYHQYLMSQRYSASTVGSYMIFVKSFLGFYKDKKSAYITITDIHKYNY